MISAQQMGGQIPQDSATSSTSSSTRVVTPPQIPSTPPSSSANNTSPQTHQSNTPSGQNMPLQNSAMNGQIGLTQPSPNVVRQSNQALILHAMNMVGLGGRNINTLTDPEKQLLINAVNDPRM